MAAPILIATSLSPTHSFSKTPQPSIHLEANYGVRGDAHAGRTTQHIYIKRKDPKRANLTQVHLLHAELLNELSLQPGHMGENLTTRGIDLHALPTGAILTIGEATIEITGYRTPCSQINGLRPKLMNAVFTEDKKPNAGIMGIILTSGEVHPGDTIEVTLPPEPHVALGPV
ncbi:MOSC domain-containing protein [Granulicella pectinivorans]|uniref:MOSC domain-containing protein n=1 Tax=Granulicella pectinivorans TaxID=474950 RepID=A0A1I6MD48_9BACT|nr:MOSC domain-containing protein [Granulicella pectinivorans]SFS13517.1 MOSC domain-containing protein [Granulicella pectinivorans]